MPGKITILLIVLLLLFLIFRFSIPYLTSASVASGPVPNSGDDRNGDKDAPLTLGDCPSTPNCQASTATRESQRCAPIPFSVPAIEAIDQVSNLLKTMTNTSDNWSIETQTGDYLHATAKSRIMGYVDDVEFLVNHQTQTLEIRSASRLGKSDLGANKKRIDQLRAALHDVLTP